MSQPDGTPAPDDAAPTPADKGNVWRPGEWDETLFATNRRPDVAEPPTPPDIPRPEPEAEDAAATDPGEQAADQPAQEAPQPSAAPPLGRLMPPTRAVERSQVAEQYVTHAPAPAAARPPAPPAPTTAEASPAPGPAAAPSDEGGRNLPAERVQQTAQVAPAETDPDSIGGLGDLPSTPIVSLPPIEEAVAGYPLSKRTGEPERSPLVTVATLAFGASAFVAMATYWYYWWVAIHIENFGTSARLIEWFDPRPGSGSSVVLVCVMALIGVIMTAGPGVAAYNLWHGASWSKVAGIVACVTSLLAITVINWSWLALGFAVIGTALVWLPQLKPYFAAWQQFSNPIQPPIVPATGVAYGPAPRHR